MNPANRSGSKYYGTRFMILEKLRRCGLISQVKFAAAATESVVHSQPLEKTDYRGAYHATMASNINRTF